jgi:hypothetical protein
MSGDRNSTMTLVNITANKRCVAKFDTDET